jgi:hypothetical protein
MAALTADQMSKVYHDGSCGKIALYALKNIDASDTVDVGETGTTIGSVTIAGTVLTIPAGPADDGVWLLVYGVSS